MYPLYRGPISSRVFPFQETLSYIPAPSNRYMHMCMGVVVGCVLQHINPSWLFQDTYRLYMYIKYIWYVNQYFVGNDFQTN